MRSPSAHRSKLETLQLALRNGAGSLMLSGTQCSSTWARSQAASLRNTAEPWPVWLPVALKRTPGASSEVHLQRMRGVLAWLRQDTAQQEHSAHDSTAWPREDEAMPDALAAYADL